jgi:hypothetical protein
MFFASSNSWDSTPGDYVTVLFTGTQIDFYGVLEPLNGVGAVSVDGGAETNVDFYTANDRGNQLLWSSPVLAFGMHTFVDRVDIR